MSNSSISSCSCDTPGPSSPEGDVNHDELNCSPFHHCSICKDFGCSENPVIMPCGHAFCSDCIRQWLVFTGEKQHCPYCRRRLKYAGCGHTLAQGLFQPGVDLRSPSSIWSFCTTCRHERELRATISIVARIWWNMCVLYPKEVRQEPRTFDWKFSLLGLHEQLRDDCAELKEWVHTHGELRVQIWKELDLYRTHQPANPEDWVPWEACIPILRKHINALFPWVHIQKFHKVQESPATADLEREIKKFSAFRQKIQIFSSIFDKFAHGLDFSGAVTRGVEIRNIQYAPKSLLRFSWLGSNTPRSSA
ncbi:hypothetical protein F4805DRAFT_420256 [Annulohypoxylon moriforme]|nr:hypothetical protein F4805DRAFT_420256 [Annulohypoxylon moriforme]